MAATAPLPRTERGARRRLATAVAPLLLLAACAAEGTTASPGTGLDGSTPSLAPTTTVGAAPIESVLRTRPFEVAHEQRTYIDDTRSTRAYDALPQSDVRTLVTELWYPADAPGTVPLVVFSHGVAGHPDKFSMLFEAWAAAGYAVAAPAFPLTSQGATPGLGGNDLANQPDDVSFVLDSVLAEAGAGGPLDGVIDPERIGVAGLSLGGMTTYAVAFGGDQYRDDRADAVIVMATTPAVPEGELDLAHGLPLLILHGSADPIFDVAAAQGAYDAAVAPRALVVLDGQSHAPPFEDDPTPVDDEVRSMTVAWWDRWLGGDADASDRLLEVPSRSAGIDLTADLTPRDRPGGVDRAG